jgi:hypothetical protein
VSLVLREEFEAVFHQFLSQLKLYKATYLLTVYNLELFSLPFFRMYLLARYVAKAEAIAIAILFLIDNICNDTLTDLILS